MVVSRVWITIQPQEINIRLRGTSHIPVYSRLLQRAFIVQRQPRSVGILVRIEQDVRPIVFVVTDSFSPRKGDH